MSIRVSAMQKQVNMMCPASTKVIQDIIKERKSKLALILSNSKTTPRKWVSQSSHYVKNQQTSEIRMIQIKCAKKPTFSNL